MPAELPPFKPDVLIIESTCGIKTLGNQAEREESLVAEITETLLGGGRCLLPVFSQGRAQEIMLILEEHWERNPRLQSFPVVMIGKIAGKSLRIFKTYTNQMNHRIRQSSKPFQFRYVKLVTSPDHIDDNGPCVVMANPGMLQSGVSRQLFERWCENERNACIICGYSVQGTLAKELTMGRCTEVTASDGRRLAVRCKVKEISFMAHADFNDTSNFIKELRPANVVLVHGEKKEMARLKKKLLNQYKADFKAGNFMVREATPPQKKLKTCAPH